MVFPSVQVVPHRIKPGFIAGRYYDARSSFMTGGAAGAAMTADVIYASPFYVDETASFDRIGVNVTAAAAAGKLIKPLIYDANAARGLPGNLFFTAPTVAADAIAQVEATIAITLWPGLWYLCAVSDGTPSIMASSTLVSVFGEGLVVATNPGGSPTRTAGTFASPAASFGAPSSYLTNSVPLVALRAA